MFGKIILQSFNNYDYYIKNKSQKLEMINPEKKINKDILFELIKNINDSNFDKVYKDLYEYTFLCKFVKLLFDYIQKLCLWFESDNSKFIDDNFKYFSTEMQSRIVIFKNFVIKINEIIKHNLKKRDDVIKQINFYEFHKIIKFYHELLRIQNDNVEFLIATCSKDELQESYDYFTNNSVEFIMADLSNK